MGNEKEKLNKERRKIIIINKPFQMAYFIKIFIISISILFLLLLLIYWWNVNYLKQILTRLEIYDEGLQTIVFKETIPPLVHLFLLIITFSLFLAVAELYISHKIVGPMFRLKKFMKIAEGRSYNLNLAFRKGDELKDVAAAFNDMLSSILNKEKEEIKAIKGFENSLDPLLAASEKSAILKMGQDFKMELEKFRKGKESYLEKREV